MKYNAAGALIWSKTYDSGANEMAEAVAVDKNSMGLYVAGAADGVNMVILRYVQPVITTATLPEATVSQLYSYPVAA
jgi:hypothetical protein